MRRTLTTLLLAVILGGGCTAKLETGYQPRPLNATEGARRAYYAPPHSPDAAGREEQRMNVGPSLGGSRGGGPVE